MGRAIEYKRGGNHQSIIELLVLISFIIDQCTGGENLRDEGKNPLGTLCLQGSQYFCFSEILLLLSSGG